MKPKPLVVEPFIDFDSSIDGGISNVNLDDTTSSEPLDVPDFDDLDSSLQIPDYGSEDESIIQDW